MAFDPFDYTNQNALEPAISRGVDAVRTGTTNAINALKGAASNFNQQSQANRPNYNMIAPSKQGAFMPGFGGDLSRSAGELYQGAVNATSDGMTAAAPYYRRAVNATSDGMTAADQAIRNGQFNPGPNFFPNTRRAAFDSATAINRGGEYAGALGRAAQGVLSIPRVGWGLVSDAADSLDYLFTQDTSNPLTLGQIARGDFAQTGGNQRGRSPSALPAPAGTQPQNGGGGQQGGNRAGRDSTTLPSGNNVRLIPDAQRAQRALDGVGAGTGALYNPSTGLMYSTENARGPGMVGNVNPETGVPYDLEAGRAVNNIRQQTIDADVDRLQQGRARVGAMAAAAQQGGGLLDDVNEQRLNLIKQIQRGTGSRTGSMIEANRNLQALRGLDQIAGDETQLEQAGIYQAGRPDGFTQQALQAGRLELDRNESLQRNARDNALMAIRTGEFLQTGRGEQAGLFKTMLEAATEARNNGMTDEFAVYANALGALGDELGGPFAQLSDDLIGVPEMMNGGLVESYAMGGMVPEMPMDALGYANGGMITPDASVPPPAVMQQYQAYADGARQMGLTAIPFDKFAALQGSSNASIPSFAEGGMVGDNDASGKMVVDTDPQAPTDSIPAMIDGQRPAKLDSGEFVIPKDVVMYYGTDKLQKMIDKVRNSEGGTANGAGQSNTALSLGFGATG